ncbi:hypothetical protein V1281_007998 [Nitrobacteraceae bacterium AZCC 2161]
MPRSTTGPRIPFRSTSPRPVPPPLPWPAKSPMASAPAASPPNFTAKRCYRTSRRGCREPAGRRLGRHDRPQGLVRYRQRRWPIHGTGRPWPCRPRKRPASRIRCKWRSSPMPCRWSGQRAAGSFRSIPTSRWSASGRMSNLSNWDSDTPYSAPGPDQAKLLRLYSEQVIPRLRAAFG